ncbi:hypothetical protein ACIQ7D_14175 [Streptomyces sp. NPDC096310]|uniref:Rv1733c family protein n=1 Tax=Streptomyces sp. NPDC096310 TaxID=3366082 RepID=UPI003805DC60
MRTVVGLWRWRRNPLRRGTDLAEAWVALTAVLLLALATPVVGWLGGKRVDAALRETARVQHEQRHRTSALVVSRTPRRALPAFDAESATEQNMGTRVVATWRAPDGTARGGTVPTPLRTPRAGDTFTIWADAQGRYVRAPMNAEAGRVHAALAGLGFATLGAGLIEGVRRLIVWRLVQRRYQRLDRAWTETGPDWGRTGAGS